MGGTAQCRQLGYVLGKGVPTMSGNASSLNTLTPQERVRLQHKKRRVLPPRFRDARIIEMRRIGKELTLFLRLPESAKPSYWLAHLSGGKVLGLETVP